MMSKRKGIILAGGTGSRLFPITCAVSKQLLPVYDKPMVYYPLSTLMLAGIREIMVITTPQDATQYQRLLGDGGDLGISIVYKEQPSPDGLAQALLIAEEWLDGAPSALILGDNILFENQLSTLLRMADQQEVGASIFACSVNDPERYGIINFDRNNKPIEIVEKPQKPESDWAVIGLYFYDSQAPGLAKTIKPSARGELEISALNQLYLDQGKLVAHKLGRGCMWMDAGLPESLFEASGFIQSVQNRLNKLIGSPHEVAFLNGFINKEQLLSVASKMSKTRLGEYLRKLASTPIVGRDI